MTPQEKAKELIDTFDNICNAHTDTAKQCALIAVDEIIEDLSKSYYPDLIGSVDPNPFYHRTKYWQQVKQEIEKL